MKCRNKKGGAGKCLECCWNCRVDHPNKVFLVSISVHKSKKTWNVARVCHPESENPDICQCQNPGLRGWKLMESNGWEERKRTGTPFLGPRNFHRTCLHPHSRDSRKTSTLQCSCLLRSLLYLGSIMQCRRYIAAALAFFSYLHRLCYYLRQIRLLLLLLLLSAMPLHWHGRALLCSENCFFFVSVETKKTVFANVDRSGWNLAGSCCCTEYTCGINWIPIGAWPAAGQTSKTSFL